MKKKVGKNGPLGWYLQNSYDHYFAKVLMEMFSNLERLFEYQPKVKMSTYLKFRVILKGPIFPPKIRPEL
jgi:hypothetical protein